MFKQIAALLRPRPQPVVEAAVETPKKRKPAVKKTATRTISAKPAVKAVTKKPAAKKVAAKKK